MLNKYMIDFRESHCATVLDMAKMADCSTELLEIVEYGGKTHPNIAARIADAYYMDVSEYNNLVDEVHKCDVLPAVQPKPAKCKSWDEVYQRIANC